jgi:hypothetical protein
MNTEQSFLDLVKVGSYQLFHRERRGAIWGRQSGMSETDMDESFQGFLFWACRVSFSSGRQNDRRILSCRGHERWTSVSCMGFIFWFYWVSFPVGDRDERKFTGLSFLDFQDFFSLRERWEESFKDYFSGFSGFSFLNKIERWTTFSNFVFFFSGFLFLEGREMDYSFPRFLQGPPCYR